MGVRPAARPLVIGARPAARPEVDAVQGMPPTVAIEQRTSRGGGTSTVATVTEVYHYLRLLYARAGHIHCPTCDAPMERTDEAEAAARLEEMTQKVLEARDAEPEGDSDAGQSRHQRQEQHATLVAEPGPFWHFG